MKLGRFCFLIRAPTRALGRNQTVRYDLPKGGEGREVSAMPPGSKRSGRTLPAREASTSDDQPQSQTPRARSRIVAAGSATRPSSPAPVRLSDLYRGRVRLGLIRDLAFGEFSPAEIASTLDGVTVQDVVDFAESHAEEITEVRAALAGQLAIETAGTWISKKQNRLAELQSDVEDLNDVLAVFRATGHLGGKSHHDTVRVKIAALRAAADEMTPRGMTLRREQDKEDKNVVHYVIEDPDIEAMT